MMDRCHLTFVQTHRMYNSKSDPNVNYGLWIIVMCLCRCISYNKCTIWWDIDNVGGGLCTCWGGVDGKTLYFTQFCCESKVSLKIKVSRNAHIHINTNISSTKQFSCLSRKAEFS